MSNILVHAENATTQPIQKLIKKKNTPALYWCSYLKEVQTEN